MSDILVPLSPGELLDKITILRIKAARMAGAQLDHVRLELEALTRAWRDGGCDGTPLGADERALQTVNEKLWDIEDRIRRKESERAFDAEFIELARSVYLCNDERAAIKKRINLRLGSRLVEEKAYAPYRAEG
ncbi:MAG: DUF6165 family protein [Steroidobacteraceae bacterium]